MKKIPTIFKRSQTDPPGVTQIVTPGCEWVFDGEGTATRKYDGTCVMLDAAGSWWARREIRAGKKVPEGAIELGVDENTGKRMVWIPMKEEGYAKLLAQAITNAGPEAELAPGTYELCAPNIDTRGGKNPENLDRPELYRHGAESIRWNGILSPLEQIEICRTLRWEGIVWHHPDGRMAKLKVRDVPA